MRRFVYADIVRLIDAAQAEVDALGAAGRRPAGQLIIPLGDGTELVIEVELRRRRWLKAVQS
jgi:hypothetical protein